MKLKKKNVVLSLLLIMLISISALYVQLQPYLHAQSEMYFQKKMTLEIARCIDLIEVPDNFLLKNEKNISVNTNVLNKWIMHVTHELNENIQDNYHAQIPIGYFTGIVFFQNKGPTLPATYLINQKVDVRYDIKTSNLGINNALLELILTVECKGNVFLGFESSQLIISENIPLALEYVQGEVPQLFPY